MIIKFELFERQDVEKAQVIRRASIIILEKIKNHILNSIKSSEPIKFKFKLTDNFYCMFERANDSGGAYGIPQSGDMRFLFIRNNELLDNLDKINISSNRKLQIFYKINWDLVRYVIYHEITHRYDDLKYDLTKIDKNVFRKDMWDLLQSNPDEYKKKSQTQYPKNTSEYNAYFLTGINLLKDATASGKYSIPNNFQDFKSDFEEFIGKNFFIKSEKFRKHFNKRIYDLWIKIQERGIKGI